MLYDDELLDRLIEAAETERPPLTAVRLTNPAVLAEAYRRASAMGSPVEEMAIRLILRDLRAQIDRGMIPDLIAEALAVDGLQAMIEAVADQGDELIATGVVEDRRADAIRALESLAERMRRGELVRVVGAFEPVGNDGELVRLIISPAYLGKIDASTIWALVIAPKRWRDWLLADPDAA